MSVKKLLVLSAAGVASVAAIAAFAGGPDMAPAPVPAPSYQGVYLEGNLGYAYVPFGKTYSLGFQNGFFTAGGDLGYQLTRFLAVEGGGYWHTNATTRYFFGSRFKISDWFLYLAGKVMAPLPWVDNLDVFAKGGVAFRRLGGFGLLFAPNNNVWFVRPLFAAGLQYHINDCWSANVQWMYVDGVNRFAIPSINQFTVGLGYKFAI